MSLVRRRALLPASAAQVARLGYGPEDDNTMVEVLYEYAREKVDKGNGYGQVAVSAPNVYDAAAQIEKANYKVQYLSVLEGTVQYCGHLLAKQRSSVCTWEKNTMQCARYRSVVRTRVRLHDSTPTKCAIFVRDVCSRVLCSCVHDFNGLEPFGHYVIQ